METSTPQTAVDRVFPIMIELPNKTKMYVEYIEGKCIVWGDADRDEWTQMLLKAIAKERDKWLEKTGYR